ncbi:hypothetical protein L3Q82_026137 [Scortum barcoo]|uniref:Uncharacterized protein n=1 Tax=Scortum barcoo TaxID=214431 RepID=A0ACB8WPI2_9TELE|nr:hypothetical protein L3Q82_026137 [Scortum barcoo]
MWESAMMKSIRTFSNSIVSPRRFLRGEYTVEVAINDYLDIYCPHYEAAEAAERMEHYVLYMVNYDGYTTCDHHRKGFKRWECNRHYSAPQPQRYQPLTFRKYYFISEYYYICEYYCTKYYFISEYYYICEYYYRNTTEYYYICEYSSPHPNLAGKPCLKLKIYVKPTNDSVYESPEPFLTDDTTGGCGLALPRLPLLSVMLLLLLLASS